MSALKVGRRVEVHSLVSAGRLNGEVGVVSGVDEEAQRYMVRVRGEEATKLVKFANLRAVDASVSEETADVVVIPARGPMYLQPVTIASLVGRVDAVRRIVCAGKPEDFSYMSTPYYHYFRSPGDEDVRWMCLMMLDDFSDELDNENMTKLGWNKSAGTIIKGPVVVDFTSSMINIGDTITYYEPFPYDTKHTKDLLRELAQVRNPEAYPAVHDRVAEGDYSIFPNMPGKQGPYGGRPMHDNIFQPF